MDKIQLIGNLTRDPEMRTVTSTGELVTGFTVACNQGKDRDGNERPAKFYNVSVFGVRAENCHKYLAKGKKVYVEGSPRARAYTANDGSLRASLDVVAHTVEFLSTAGTVEQTDEEDGVQTQPECGGVQTEEAVKSRDRKKRADGFTETPTPDDLPF